LVVTTALLLFEATITKLALWSLQTLGGVLKRSLVARQLPPGFFVSAADAGALLEAALGKGPDYDAVE
jgi:hypothetical protein